MNGQLQQAVAELIKKSISTMEGATSFLYSELPEVIRQLLVWRFITSALNFTFFIIVLVAIIASIKWAFVLWSGDTTGELVVIPMVIILLFISIIVYDITWLQILIAPKVYLLEYASQLLK